MMPYSLMLESLIQFQHICTTDEEVNVLKSSSSLFRTFRVGPKMRLFVLYFLVIVLVLSGSFVVETGRYLFCGISAERDWPCGGGAGWQVTTWTAISKTASITTSSPSHLLITQINVLWTMSTTSQAQHLSLPWPYSTLQSISFPSAGSCMGYTHLYLWSWLFTHLEVLRSVWLLAR